MKNIMKKLIVIMTILMMFNINLPKESKAAEVTDEFAELLTTYESEAPSIESAELSTTFTSNKEVEVYIKTSREDVNKVTISAWSGGPYEQYLVSKEATYDELRNVYTVLFPLNEIVNTTTNQIENSSEVLYYFDACIYSTNGSMSYVKLDEVEYTESGIKTQVTTNEEEKQVIEVKAEEDGYVAIVNAGEEVTEETEWQPVSKGVNTYALPTATETDEVQNVQVLYKAGAEVTEEDIANGNVTSNEVMLLSEGGEETEEQDPNMSYFQDDETFTFEFSQNSGANDWIAYTDTPNVLESRIQGMPDTEAVATIKVHTEYPGVLSFDYMVSSEETFDKFSIEIEGAKLTKDDKDKISLSLSGQQAWEPYIQSYEKPNNGIITITLKYSKDFNVNRYDDKAVIRNLKFEPQIPVIEDCGEVVINESAEFTNNTTLNLKLNAQNFTKMYITEVEEKPDASDANWQSYQDTVTYTLKDTTDGLKTVYVYYMNEVGAITLRPIEASIKLDTSVPTKMAPRVESTSNTITAYLNQTDANEFTMVYYGYRLFGSTDEYTWSENIRVNDLADVSQYTISGLTEMQEYEVVTKVSDGVNGDIVSEVSTIKTKIPSDRIVITKSTEDATLGEVVVNIEWNNTEYTKEYSLDGINWPEETASVTTITLTENATIYYRMKNDTYDTGILECNISNIDHGGPQVEKIEVIDPVSGTYGIDDEITIQLTWNEEATVVTAPTLNIKFEDNNIVSLTAIEQTSTTLTYKYTIVGTDAGYLSVDSLTGGLVKDNLNNESTYELPELTGSKIFVENIAYIASTNKYYGTLQRAINAAGTEATTIKLIANNVLRDTVVIKEGQNIVLDLNGKTVSYESEENIVTAIENRGTLEIIDSTAEKAGLILASSKTKSAYTIVNNPTGNITIKNIKVEAISNSNSVSLESYALYNKGAGIITLGTNDSDVSVTKPELKATAKNSYGLYIANAEGTINYYEGTIKGTKKATYSESGILAYTLPTGYSEKIELRNEDGKEYEVAYLFNESAVELTMNGITTGYKSILEAVAKVPTDGRQAKIKMLTDETLEDIVKIYKGQNVEIDLNGHVLTRTEDIGGYVYALINNGTLKISDTSEAQLGEIRSIASKDVTTYAVYNYTDGNLTIDSGKYFAQINVENKSKYAYGLESNSSKKITINAGEIYREQNFFDILKIENLPGKYLNQKYEAIDGIEYKVNYISENPVIEMTVNDSTSYYSGIQQAINNAPIDGTLAIIKMESDEELINYIQIPENKNIQLNLNGKIIISNNLEYVIYAKSTLLEITDDSIEQTGTISSSSGAYGVYNASSGTIEINSGTISTTSTSTTSTTSVYGVYNASSGTIEINSGTISSSVASYSLVYGVYNASSGIAKIDGGSISASSSSADSSYGIYNASSGIVEINGGSISAINSSVMKVVSTYGVYINNKDAKVKLNGGEWKGKSNGIYIPNGMEINNSGIEGTGKVNIPQNKCIGYRMEGEYIVNYVEDGSCTAQLTIGETTTQYVSIQDAINNIPIDSTLGIVKLLQNESIGRSIEIKAGQNVEIDLNGKEIRGNIGEIIINNGDLRVVDSSTNETGVITSTTTFNTYCCGVYNAGSGIVEINGGTIKSFTPPISSNSGYSLSYSVYNASSGIVKLNGGTIISSTSPLFRASTPSSVGIYNKSSGIVEINSGTITSFSERGSGVVNIGSGIIEINGGTISSSDDSVYNDGSGTIEINGGIISSLENGVYNASSGTIEINRGIIKSFQAGVFNEQKGTIIIGKNDDILMNSQIEIISNSYGIYINKIGGSINLYDGTVKAQKAPIYPSDTLFETISEVSETSYIINIPIGTEICDGTEGDYKTKYLKFKDNYVPSGDELTDTELPYVQNVEVVSPITGNYAKNQVVTLKVNWSENINTTLNTAPELIIKFEGDVERSTSIREIGSDYITYEYIISESDNGYLKLVSYLNGIVTDTSGNNYQQKRIKLTGNEIKAGTKAYIPSIGKYYYSIQEAINNCELNAIEYTSIKLLNNDCYYISGITINETQKIEIDLNGKEIIGNIEKTITNSGDLRIIDSSITQKGSISSFSMDISYGIYNAGSGTIEINSGIISSSSSKYAYSVYNASSGAIKINGGTISSHSSMTSPYCGVYNASNGAVEINGGTINGVIVSDSDDCYGVYNASSGIVEINEVTISIYSERGYSDTYGIYNKSSGTIKINGGTISSSSSYDGYGVYNASSGIIEINGGTINSSSRISYGVYIKDKGAKIKFTGGELKGGSNGIYIPLEMEINNNGIEEIGKVSIPQGKHIGYRVEGDYVVNYIEDGEYLAELTIGEIITQYVSIQDAISYIPLDGTLGKVKLLQNESLGRSIEIKEGQNVEIDLNGKEIRSNIEKTITNNGDLRIIDSSTMQTGKISSSSSYYYSDVYGVYNASSGMIEINGGIISSFSSSSLYVYGVYNASSGKVEINGGTISSSSHYYGYGVYNASSGTIKINEGTISSSDDDYKSYGVYNASSGTVEINGGTISSSSISSSISSYGVYIENKDAKIKFTGGELKGKTNGIYIPTEMEINNNGIEEIGKVSIPQGKHIGYRVEGGYIVNYIEDGEYLAELTIGEIITQYISIQDAISYIPLDGTLGKVKLLQNESLGRSIEIKEGQNVEIDLNGKEIRSNIEKTITNSGDLRIIDSSTMQTGTINSSSSHYVYGVYNASNGTVEINGGTISSSSSSSSSNSYGVYNASSGKVEINGGTISSFSYYSYGVYFKDSNSYFYFNGGKILGKTKSIYPTTKSIELESNTYVKNYIENIGGTYYDVAEVAPTSNIKVINNGNITYYKDLKTAMSTTAAPANNILTEITLMADADILSNITIANGQKILLDLNGKTISVKKYNTLVRKPFINNGTFEIMDSVGTGQINIESTDYDDYGIYNNATTAKYKMYGGTMNITSLGNNAYGIYNYKSTNDGITIEGGSINVTTKQAENGVTSGKAYGIYNAYSSSNLNVVVAGENTNIVATSELNDSYGYYSTYSEKLTLGTQDGLVGNLSPYIVGGTNGIYKSVGTISMYDGEITGPQNASVSKAIDNIEDETIVYVLNNYDGTESTMLLKEVRELMIDPKNVYFTEINDKKELDVIYLPVDASDVTIDYVIDNENIVQVRMDNNKYMVVARGNGTTKITFTVTDKTGKSISADCSVTVDDKAPTNTAPTANSTATTVTITCNQTDEIAMDASSIRYAISADNGITWSEWTNRNVFSGLDAQTEYLVKTKASDMVGNETESLEATIKTKLPNNSTLVLEPDTVTKENVKVIITWNNAEGLPQYYKIEDGDWNLVTGENTEVTITETNVAVYTKLIYDGNEDSNVNYILVDNIDRIAPKGTISINEDEANYKGDITLSINATDDACVSGDNLGAVAYMYLTEENLTEAPNVSDENWIRYEGNNSAYPYIITKEGDALVYLWLRDKAGNISEKIVSDTVKYNPPTVVLFEDGVEKGEFDTINDAYTAARENNTNASIIRVYKSHTMTSQLTIGSTKNIVLDLNGKTVSSALTRTITNNGTLEITDSIGKGVLTNTYASSSMYTIYNTKNLIISGGTIEARNTTPGNYIATVIRNNDSTGNIKMTGGKLYATTTTTSASSSYSACGIYNYSSYTSGTSLEITGGTIEIDALDSAYGYGIYQCYSGRAEISNVDIIVNATKSYAYGIYRRYSGKVTITSGTITAKSQSGTAYGISNSTSSNDITIGNNDGNVNAETPVISGSTYGIYSSGGYRYYFYDGVIKGKQNNSIYCAPGYLITPQYYGVNRSLEDNIETATLTYDNIAPKVEEISITNNIDVNTQTVIAKNVTDEGTGIVGYILTQTSTVPTQSSTGWTSVTQTNGPIDIAKTADKNNTWYFWVMDAAGNVSETKTVFAENIHIKVTGITLSDITVPLGQQITAMPTLTPAGSEAKKITYTSSAPDIAYVHPETGEISGLKFGKSTLTVTLINYDSSIIKNSVTVTVVDALPEIVTEPVDRTVKEKTTTEFTTHANGTNLEYQWYKVNGENIEVIEDETNKVDKIYKSNIEGQSNGVSIDTITIKATEPGTLSFDYMVSSEEINDVFSVTITDANGTTTAVNNISGEVGWTSYSADFTPTAEDEIIVTLTYAKNDSIDSRLDYGAIRNLGWYHYGMFNSESTYEDDDYYTFTTPDTSIYDTTTDKPWIISTEDGETVYKSSNEGIATSASTASIIVENAVSGTLSFDYAIYSEGQSWDYLIIKIVDGNGEKTIVPQTGGTGQSDWKTCSTPITPDQYGKVKITLLYIKDGGGDVPPDRAAIKNLKVDVIGYNTRYTTFQSDDLYTISSNNWSTNVYMGMNTPTLIVPGSMVTESISGTKYFCEVSNSAGTVSTRQALITVADEEIPVPEQLGKEAPTLILGYKEISATCNQTGEGITETYYAISTDDVTFGEWQTSNTFTGLEEGTMYYVKTKVVNSNGEQESLSAFAVAPMYVASLTEEETTTYYYNVQDAITAANSSNPENASIVTLLNNELRTTQVNVTSGKNILLDLNGKELMVASSSGSLNGISNAGKLELKDDVGTGKFVTSSSYNYSYTANGIYNTGKFTFTSGSIEVYKVEAYKDYARGIYNASSSAIATIGNSEDALNITNPSITSTGYGLYCYSGTIYFYDGIITSGIDKVKYNSSSEKTILLPGYHINTETSIDKDISYLAKTEFTETNALVMDWTIPVDAAGAGNGTTIRLPIPTHKNNNYIVDWGDGSTGVYNIDANFPEHNYRNTEEKVYEIKIAGTVNNYGYTSQNTVASSNNYYTFTKYLKTLKAWGELNATRYGFSQCKGLSGTIPSPTENSFKQITDFSNLFYNCTELTGAIPEGFFDNTSKVTNFVATFQNCTKITSIPQGLFSGNIGITSNTSSSSGFASTFNGCTDLTSVVIDSKYIGYRMFYGCNKLTDITITDNVEGIYGTSGSFTATSPYNSSNKLFTTLHTTNQLALDYDWEADNRMFDEEAPEVTFTPSGDTVWAKSHSITINVTDALTEVLEDSLKYQWTQSIDAPSLESFETNGTSFVNGDTIVKDTNSGNDWYLWIKATDIAGNTAIIGSDAFYLDNEKPKVDASPDSIIHGGKVELNLTDAHAGVVAWQITDSETAPTDWNDIESSNNTTVETTLENVGSYYAWSIDEVGNVSDPVIINVTAKSIGSTDIEINLDENINYYTGKDVTPKILASFNGKDLVEGTDFDAVYSDNIEAGINTAKISITGKGNYTDSKEIKFTIAPKEVTVDWKNTILTFNSKAQAPTASVDSGVSGEVITLAVSGEKIDAGENYQAEIDLANSYVTGGYGKLTNYKLTKDKTLFTINPNSSMEFIPTLNNNNLEYTGTALTPGATVKVMIDGVETDLQDGKDFEISHKNNIDVGTEDSKPTLVISGKGNYEGSYKEVEFVIEPAKLLVVWGNTTLRYTGKPQAPMVGNNNKLEGLNGDIINITVTGNGVNVGNDYSAKATINGAEVGKASNYTLVNDTVSYSIDKGISTLSVENLDVIVQEGDSITIKYSYDGDGEVTVFSDDESIATVKPDTVNKQITITGVSENNTFVTIKAEDGTNYVGTSETIKVSVENTTGLFTTEWQIPVDANGAGNGTTVVLPIPGHITNNFEVRWGDGTRNRYTTEGFPTHTYQNTEEKLISIQIKGKVNSFGYSRTNEVTQSNTYSSYYTFTNYLRSIVSWGDLGATSIGFSNCTLLAGTIPEATGFANLTSTENMFYNCSLLVGSIPTDFLKEATGITKVNGMFMNCAGLNGEISSDFFASNTGIKTFENTFAGCANLTGSIPTGLFDNMTEVTSYAGTFSGCSKLSGIIPEDLFASSSKVKSFNQTFANCIGLVSAEANAEGIVYAVPIKLFENNINVNNYYRTFYNCTGLTGLVDSYLFESNIIITAFPKDSGANGNYKGTFEGCSKIKSVSMNTFIIGHEMFKDCTALENIYLTRTIDIGNMAFYGCNNLTKIKVDKEYMQTIGIDAFEYTGSNPTKLFTQVNRENEMLVNYDWVGDNRNLDIEAPKGRVEIVTGKYPFTNTQDVALKITLSDNYSETVNCEIAIVNEDIYARYENEEITIEQLPWQTYLENTEWTLTANDGIKTVYVLFKDEIGNISNVRKNIAG